MQYQMPSISDHPVPNCERLFHYRSCCYKIGLIGLFSSFLAFIWGISTSSWIIYANRSGSLWNVDCSVYLCNTELLITRILFACYGGAYLISLGSAVYENSKKVDRNTYHSRKLEWLTLGTGIIGMVSLIVLTYVYGESVHASFGWSRTITILSLVALFVSLLILLCSNSKPVHAAGIIISLNNRQRQQQPQQQVLVQGASYPPPALPNQMYAASQLPYPAANAYPAPQYPPQSQPLLPQPQPQPYPYPAYPEPPPPYSMPPAYPSQPLGTQAEYPGLGTDAQVPGALQPNAPPME